jgi:hypothetical protein
MWLMPRVYRSGSAADRIRIAFRVFAITELEFTSVLNWSKLCPSSHQFGLSLRDVFGKENDFGLTSACTRSTTIMKRYRATARFKLEPSLRIIRADFDRQSKHVTVERANLGDILHE